MEEPLNSDIKSVSSAVNDLPADNAGILTMLELKERAIEASNNGIIITDARHPDNPVIYVNSAFSRITGYPKEELIGFNCRFLQGDDKNQPGLIELRNAISEKRPCIVKIRNYRKDGSQIWVELSISPLFDESGEITHYIGVQSDITQRIVTEELLTEANTRLSEMVHNMAAGMLVEDERRHIIVVNEEFCRMFKIPADPIDLIGSDCSQSAELSKHLFADPDLFISRIDEIVRERKLVKHEEILLADGQIYERDYIPIFISGQYSGQLWNYQNVTEKKNYQKEIAELKLFYEQTLNDLPGQIAVLDRDFRYIYANPGSIGNPEIRKWIVGKDDFEYCRFRNISLSIAEKRRVWFERALKEKAPVKFDEYIEKDDNTVLYFERVISPILDSSGSVKHFLAYGVDVTDRKRAEIDLLKIKNQLESILDAVGEGIITIDRTGNIILVNDEIKKMFGWSKEELLSSRIHILIPEQLRRQYTELMRDFLKTKDSSSSVRFLSVMGQKKDGTIFPVSIRVNETMIGEKLFFTIAINDITEVNKLIKDLEASNKALSDFAYIASHDLREPLRKISSFGSLLSKSLAGRLDEDDSENLEFMIEGARRMQQMIDDLLLYSRISVNTTKHTNIDLDYLVHEILKFDLAELIEDNDAKVVVENTLGFYKGEKTQMKQLFQNLIGNGIKYRKKDVSPIITISSERENGILCVRVEDNGIGINEKYKYQIFEMFKRLHSKESYSGSGIGLAVCKKIIDLYSGEIEVSSSVGKGSVFEFRLPIR